MLTVASVLKTKNRRSKMLTERVNTLTEWYILTYIVSSVSTKNQKLKTKNRRC